MAINVECLMITQEHIDHPTKDPKLSFEEGFNGRIYCPISLDNLEVDDICLKVNCCFKVFKIKGFKKILIEYGKCPMCKTSLNSDYVLSCEDQLLRDKNMFARLLNKKNGYEEVIKKNRDSNLFDILRINHKKLSEIYKKMDAVQASLLLNEKIVHFG